MQFTGFELDKTRRRILARLAGVVTGAAVALTFVQFSTARRAPRPPED